MIEEVLKDKREQLKRSFGTEDAKFSKEDIDVLLDCNELRVLKVTHSFPKNFEFSKSKEESRMRALKNNSVYCILEYCVIAQPILQDSVGKVFKNWRFINGRRAARRGACKHTT